MTVGVDRAELLRLGAAAAAGSLVSDRASAAAGKSFPRPHPAWRFVFVNHALTNPFFVPARYGSEDAAALYGARVDWTGSSSSDVGEMVKAMELAIDGTTWVESPCR